MKRTISLKARAIRYLSAREHSKRELAAKLQRFAEAGDDLDALMDWLEKEGYLSDTRFAESLVRRRMGRYGDSRIRQELKSHQVAEVFPDAAMRQMLPDESARAREVWEKKFGQPPADAKERARQMRFLQQRGFSTSAIRKAMAGDSD